MKIRANSRLRPGWIVIAVLAVLVAVVLGSVTPDAEADTPETAVVDWNRMALDALGNAPSATTPGAGMTAYILGIHLAMVQGAVYDSVNSIDGTYEPYLDGLDSAPANASKAAAVATAAHDTLVAILNQHPTVPPPAPGQPTGYTTAVRDAIITRLGIALANQPVEAGADVSAGEDAGVAAAAAMIAERAPGLQPAGDGRYPPSASAFRFTPGTEPGQWRPTAPPPPPPNNDPFAWASKVRPFVIESNTQFQSKGPHALTSGAYAKEYDEVKRLGEVDSALTAEQGQLRAFFQPNPVEIYHRAYRAYAVQQGLDVVEQARFFALLSLAGADTFITCWEDKARWSFWRPITAIHNGDTDGNPQTDGDTEWDDAVNSPPYPDHSSGYNCITGASMEVGELWFGHGRTQFTISHATGSVPPRTYDHFRDVWADTIEARILQGIHFRAPDVQGAKIGRDVARWVEKHALQPAK
jgi:hypothetical protein